MSGYLGRSQPTYWHYMLRRSEQQRWTRLSEQSFQRTLRAHDQEQPPAPRHPPSPAQPVLLLRNNRLLLLATDVASRTTGAATIHAVALPNRPSRFAVRQQIAEHFDDRSTDKAVLARGGARSGRSTAMGVIARRSESRRRRWTSRLSTPTRRPFTNTFNGALAFGRGIRMRSRYRPHSLYFAGERPFPSQGQPALA